MNTASYSHRTTINIQEKANLIWAIADKLVGTYKPHEYGNVILPMCVIKRFSDTLAPTKDKVLKVNADLDNKLSLEHHRFEVQPMGSIELKPTTEDKTIKGEKGGSGKNQDEKRDLLANIIDKINMMYAGNFTEADRVIVETIYDKFKVQNKTLKRQAKNSDVNMFSQNIFPEVFSKIAQQCYVEQMDAFAKLFEEPTFYKRICEEMGRAMYFNFKNGE